ncbi:alpha/beta hydrolase family protein [Candidatus Bipolaricaulota bacterium]
MSKASFDYDRLAPLDVRPVGSRSADGITLSELTYAAPFGRRRAAYVVRPEGDGPFPVILYVHWYEPSAPDSNRTQFLDEARGMAARGAMSLLIETAWSDREWFLKRTQADDFGISIEIVVELRRAMDLLLDQPGADPARFAYVGHDFGAMYGVVMGSIDPRPTCYVLMAGTPRFPDWFLYYPPIEGEEREAFQREMAELDPIERVKGLSPAPILFQFGRDDPHVPVERAEAFFAAADEPKEIAWYESGHGLSEEAARTRVAWVERNLNLPSL